MGGEIDLLSSKHVGCLTFPSIVSRSWSHFEMLVDAISKFTDKATRWNRMQFGNVFNRKKNIMARLNGI